MNKRLWKSLKPGLKSNNGNVKWHPGVWQHQDGEIKLCKNGFHASTKIVDAMKFTNAAHIARVEVKGESDVSTDKQAWSDMRILKSHKWTKRDSVRTAIFTAELVIGNSEKIYPDDDRPKKVIAAAKKWLKNPTEKNRAAACSAARSAASAAHSTYYSAFYAAAAAAAAKSAYLAVAASAAVKDKIETYIKKILKEKK